MAQVQISINFPGPARLTCGLVWGRGVGVVWTVNVPQEGQNRALGWMEIEQWGQILAPSSSWMLWQNGQ